MQKHDISWIWETSLKFMYGPVYIDSLDALLRQHKVKRILDCACGIGFPAIELHKRGYEVTCTDADELMLRRFRRNCFNEGVKLDARQLKWHELPEHFRDEFDCVLCRGNSLPYAASWGEKSVDTAKAKEEIQKAIENFHAVLKPNGICYIDVAPRESLTPKQTDFLEDFGEQRINGKTAQLRWRIRHDLVKKERIWSPEVIVKHNGSCVEKVSATRKGYLLRHSELLALLNALGFKKIEQYVEIPGEGNYDVFIAHKEEGDRHESNADTAGA